MTAPRPPDDLGSRQPLFLELPAGSDIHRFYRAARAPLHFDRSDAGRFNAPDGAYGVLYAAASTAGAFAETFLREPGRTLLAADVVAARGYVRLRTTRALRLIQFTGKGLARLAATAEVAHAGLPYAIPQAWSAALHAHPAKPDGIAYRARHDDEELCFALFDRARRAIREARRDTQLDADWFWEIAEAYGVGFSPG